VVTDTLNSRVIVVSPYGPLNIYFENVIPNLIKGGYVDIVNQSDKNEPPYIEINKKENGSQKPFWIIDFQRIMTEQPSPAYLSIERLDAIKELLFKYQDSGNLEKIFSGVFQKNFLYQK
jgi:hypothetical protein